MPSQKKSTFPPPFFSPQDDVDDGYADDAAAEAAYLPVSEEDDEEEEEDFDEPDESGYATASAASLAGESNPSVDLDILEARQAEGEREGRGSDAPTPTRFSGAITPLLPTHDDGHALTHTLYLALSPCHPHQPSRRRSA